MVYRNNRSRRYDDSDDETAYSDADSYDSIPVKRRGQVPGWMMARQLFYLDKEDGQEAAYEAWSLRYDELDDFVQRQPMNGEQSDLTKMHLNALEEFQRKHRRGWASRVFGGRRKNYAEQLDEKCKKFPQVIQEAIHSLLEDRGRQSSTIYRTRVWTVAVVRVEEPYRFASSELAEARRHKLRFWKNSRPVHLNYHVVIRGCETEVCKSPRGFTQFADFTNPWTPLDAEESRRMGRQRDRIFDEKFAANRRKRSPSPPSYQRWRDRSFSPERGPDRTRYRSTSCRYRDQSPYSEPETEVEARRYIRMSRATARNAPPPVPMAPPPQQPNFDRYAPPRFNRSPSPYADRSYSRPRVPYVEENTWMPGAQHDQSEYSRPTVSVYAPQHFGFPALDGDDESMNGGPRGTPECVACQVTPECEHYSRSRVCDRPINWRDDRATHPPCFICMAAGVTPNPFHLFPPPPPPPCMMPIPVQPLYCSQAPPPYPPTERPANSAIDRNIAEEVIDTTDIESDGGDLDDGETTAVAESPQRPKDE